MLLTKLIHQTINFAIKYQIIKVRSKYYRFTPCKEKGVKKSEFEVSSNLIFVSCTRQCNVYLQLNIVCNVHVYCIFNMYIYNSILCVMCMYIVYLTCIFTTQYCV